MSLESMVIEASILTDLEEAWHQWIPLKQHRATLEKRTFAFLFCFFVGSTGLQTVAQSPLLNYTSPRTDHHSQKTTKRLWEKVYSLRVSPVAAGGSMLKEYHLHSYPHCR